MITKESAYNKIAELIERFGEQFYSVKTYYNETKQAIFFKKQFFV
jgi:hypothetical protein